MSGEDTDEPMSVRLAKWRARNGFDFLQASQALRVSLQYYVLLENGAVTLADKKRRLFLTTMYFFDFLRKRDLFALPVPEGQAKAAAGAEKRAPLVVVKRKRSTDDVRDAVAENTQSGPDAATVRGS